MDINVQEIAQGLINELAGDINHKSGMIEGIKELYKRIRDEIERQAGLQQASNQLVPQSGTEEQTTTESVSGSGDSLPRA